MPTRSQALLDFRASIAIAETLIKKEAMYTDPPAPDQLKIVQGLRGGAIVLMVAAFENFLEELVAERLDYLKQHPKYNPKKLPNELMFYNCSFKFKKTIEDSGKYQNITDRITLFQQAARIITRDEIDSSLFSILTENNPKAKKVQKLFFSLGIQDIFKTIKSRFDKRWKVKTTGEFIQDKLDSIIDRRHEVAHTANVMNVSRKDLKEAIKFFRLLANLCDEELNLHIQRMIR